MQKIYVNINIYMYLVINTDYLKVDLSIYLQWYVVITQSIQGVTIAITAYLLELHLIVCKV